MIWAISYLYSRRNCPYFYIRCEMKKVNFTLQVNHEKINKEKVKNQLTFQNEFIIMNERHRDVSTISDELLIQEKYSSG